MAAMIATDHIGRSLANPVLEAQVIFRALLLAMSEPGSVHRLPVTAEPAPGLAPASAVTLLTLADQDTPVWLDPAIGAAAADYVRFHCGAPISERTGEAVLAVLDGGSPAAALSVFNPGVELYPDRSAIIIVQCARLAGGPNVTLRGPGIRGRRTVAPRGLHARFWDEMRANNARYPLGVDIVLAAGRDVMAVPRSTAIQVEEAY